MSKALATAVDIDVKAGPLEPREHFCNLITHLTASVIERHFAVRNVMSRCLAEDLSHLLGGD
jgi:hypothetical protein